jgi:hypothetical protein
MGSLNNLYISQSYQGLLTFSTNSGSTSTLTQISDGSGNGLGLYLNNAGVLRTTTSISSSTIEATNLVIKNKIELTGSIDIDGPVTASNAFIENNLIVSGTLFANKVVTLIESSSIIFSSGSNILGDSILDTQTLNGTIIMSGSSSLTGSMGITGDISSSTLSGVGNVTNYSASVQAKFNSVNNATASLFTSASLGLTTASVNINVLTFTKGNGEQFNLAIQPIDFNSGSYTLTSSFNAYTASTNSRLSNLETTTASINISVSNLNQYTQSNDTKWNTLQNVTSSLLAYTASQNNLNATLATTGSNTFVGNEIVSGSLRGGVITLSVSSQTASMNCSLGNFFILNLPTASTTYLNPTNVQPGQSIQLLVTQGSTTGSLNYPSTILFATGSDYSASIYTNSKDILSFLAMDATNLYGVSVKNFV